MIIKNNYANDKKNCGQLHNTLFKQESHTIQSDGNDLLSEHINSRNNNINKYISNMYLIYITHFK